MAWKCFWQFFAYLAVVYSRPWAPLISQASNNSESPTHCYRADGPPLWPRYPGPWYLGTRLPLPLVGLVTPDNEDTVLSILP